jgi:hypothetical protein
MAKRTKEQRQADKDAKKIDRHMAKNEIGQSDGLEVQDGKVVYDPNRDDRSIPFAPTNTPKSE